MEKFQILNMHFFHRIEFELKANILTRNGYYGNELISVKTMNFDKFVDKRVFGKVPSYLYTALVYRLKENILALY